MTENQSNIEQKEKSAQLIWTGLILSFFLIQAAIWSFAITLTASDPSHAVVSGYDEQALKWDQIRLLQMASQELGWKANVAIQDDGDVFGQRTLKMTLRDADKNPIENAKLTMVAFHCGRASETQTLEFSETNMGEYEATIRVRHRGEWQLEGFAQKGSDSFLFKERLFIEKVGRQN